MNKTACLNHSLSPLQEIARHPGAGAGIRLWIKRDDLIGGEVQGNKWRKMEPLIARRPTGVLGFGGAFSNHLYALAAAGRQYGFPTAAIIRSAWNDAANPTLRELERNGMALHFVGKTAYDEGPSNPAVQAIMARYPGYELLPEGGASPEAAASCSHLVFEVQAQLPGPVIWAVPAGTGCTAAGIINAMPDDHRAMVFPATDRGFTLTMVERFLPESRLPPGAEIITGYDFGGFARWSTELDRFVRRFRDATGILLDPVYTAKMMYGLYDLLEKDRLPGGANIVAIHTGGLQGWAGMQKRYGIALP